MVILMLNLLISIISEKYDGIRDGQDTIRIQEMTVMLIEATAYNAWKGEQQLVAMVSIFSQKVKASKTELLGITNRIKHFISSGVSEL